MKVCRSNYLEIVKIVPFSERRSCFCHFLRSNGIAIEKINYKNHISKKNSERLTKFTKVSQAEEITFMKKTLLLKLLKMLKNF